MIIKNFELKKKLLSENKFFLLYGNNEGLIEETIKKDIEPKLKGKIFRHEEKEVINNLENFKEEVLNKSFFDNEKILIISRVSDKMISIIEEIIEKDINDLSIILKAGILEKKSKIRNFFEKNNKTICVPFYEDNHQTLFQIIKNYLNEKKINLSQENMNLIIERSRGNRVNLNNELSKIESLYLTRKDLKTEDIIKLTNLSENYQISELVDNTLAKNKRKTLNILNENNFAQEDYIMISRIFLQKLKRLLKIRFDMDQNKKNIDSAITAYKPPIFWKEKEIVKNQIINLDYNKIQKLLIKVNQIECDVKKNPNISFNIITNFILEQTAEVNNVI